MRTQGQVAAFFGVGLDTVKAWRAQRMPGSPQRWDLAEIARWLVRRREGAGVGGDIATQFKQARTLREIKRAEREGIEVERLKGRYVERDELEKRQSELARVFVSFLDRLPRELDLALDQVPKRRRRDTIQRALDEARERLAAEIG